MARNKRPAKDAVSQNARSKPGDGSSTFRKTAKDQFAKSVPKAKRPSNPNRNSEQFFKPPEKPEISTRPPRRLPARVRLPETIGTLLTTYPDQDYALLDSGNGLKLERYGSLKIVRPEGQAIWQPSLSPSDWENVDAVFTGDTDEEGLGRWQFPRGDLKEIFPMKWEGMAFWGRFTSFRHTGVFPEQAAHWRAMADQLEQAKSDTGSQPRILNLFGYTGVASLVAARAGAHVTHVDASKKAIGWARENQELAGLSDKPIRWICDDAVKFCEREARRGNTYDGILLDPPAYGRGPKGEVWQMFEDLPYMVDLCRELMSDKPLFTVLTAYTIRASFLSIHELMQEVFGDIGGRLESGELTILTEDSDRRISTSMFSRWTKA
ncbi:MAG: class I SAM-dependent methyltransferase [Salaquimonas sp.]